MRRLFLALGLLLGGFAAAMAANIPLYSFVDPSNLTAAMNAFIQTLNASVTPQTMATNSAFRNYLDNGAMAIAQRGTGIQTGGTTSGCNASSTYVADRWCVDTNVGSGAGRGQVVTASPAPPVGFAESVKVYRTSGALLQPVCYIQEIPTADSVQLAGQPVVLSAYLQALAGMSGTGTVTGYVITGTGTNEGLGTMTASPAVTPAFTGLATAGSGAFALPTASPAWNRYATGVIAIPTSVTEIAVEFCFTPAATGAGTTDGFAITGAQLEPVGLNDTVASPFEFRPYGIELRKAQRYYYEIDEATGPSVIAVGRAHSTTVAEAYLNFPEIMFKVPTMGYTAGFATETTAAGGTLGACSALATSSTVTSTAAALNGVSVACTATTVPAAGTTIQLFNDGASGKITASADF